MSAESSASDEKIVVTSITSAEPDEGGLWTVTAWSADGMVAKKSADTEQNARQRLEAFLQNGRYSVLALVGPQTRFIAAPEPFGVTMHPSLEATDEDGEYVLREGSAISETLTSQLPLKIVINQEAEDFIATAPELDPDQVGRGEDEDEAFKALLRVIDIAYATFVEQMPKAEDYIQLRENLVKWFKREEPKAETEKGKAE